MAAEFGSLKLVGIDQNTIKSNWTETESQYYIRSTNLGQ